MQSQFDRECIVETNFVFTLNEKFRKDQKFLKKYENFKEKRLIPINVTWEEMKQKFDWGFRKGSIIDPLVTWIYIRPDILHDINIGLISCSDLTTKCNLNEHYFLVEKKAIAYLKLHSSGFTDPTISSSDNDSSDENSKRSHESELSYQALRRKRLRLSTVPIGIDDSAVEDK